MKSSQAISRTGPVFGCHATLPWHSKMFACATIKIRCYQLSLQSNSCTCSYTYWILIVKVFLYFIRALLFVIFIIFHFNMSRLSSLFSRIQHFDLLHQSLSDGLKIRQDGCYVGYDLCLALFGLRTKKTLKTTATKVITSKKKLLYYKNVTRDWFFRLLVESIRKLYNWLKHRDLTNTSNHVQFSTHQEKSSLPPVFPPLYSIFSRAVQVFHVLLLLTTFPTFPALRSVCMFSVAWQRLVCMFSCT